MAEILLRPPRDDEVADVAALVNDLGRSLHGEDTVEISEVEKWFSIPSVDRGRDLLLAELADGPLAGFGSLADLAEDHAILWLRVALHPVHGSAAAGQLLLDALEQRARERGHDGSLIHAGCSSEDERAAGIYEQHGYQLVRHFFRMLVDLGREPSRPVWPQGLELRPFDVDNDLEAVFKADEEAFADHWGFVRVSFDDWRHWMTGGPFDPSLWFLAWDGDEIAGFSLGFPQEGGDTELGWVQALGVRRPWRRRGLALALLLHSFGEFHGRGHKRVGLGVDAENTTGALRLYEKAGMRVVRQSDTWAKPVAAILASACT